MARPGVLGLVDDRGGLEGEDVELVGPDAGEFAGRVGALVGVDVEVDAAFCGGVGAGDVEAYFGEDGVAYFGGGLGAEGGGGVGGDEGDEEVGELGVDEGGEGGGAEEEGGEEVEDVHGGGDGRFRRDIVVLVWDFVVKCLGLIVTMIVQDSLPWNVI